MLLQRLRNETARNHAAIESQMPLLDPSLSLEMYRDLLARFRGFYVPLEQQLQSRVNKFWPDTEYVWAEREKSPLLEFDLRTLSQITSADDECLVLPSLESPAEVLGCLYVVEGATLGGQVIMKLLSVQLGLTPQTGAAFFNGYGADTSSRWQSFRQFLTHNAEPLDHDNEIVASANATFVTLAEWLFPVETRDVSSEVVTYIGR